MSHCLNLYLYKNASGLIQYLSLLLSLLFLALSLPEIFEMSSDYLFIFCSSSALCFKRAKSPPVFPNINYTEGWWAIEILIHRLQEGKGWGEQSRYICSHRGERGSRCEAINIFHKTLGVEDSDRSIQSVSVRGHRLADPDMLYLAHTI